MHVWKHALMAALLVAAPVLSGCGIDPENDEAFVRAQRDLDAARADPEIRKNASAPLMVADDMLGQAKEAEDVETLHRLSFRAQQQVDLARQLTEARAREEKLMALMEKNSSAERTRAEPAQPDISVNRLPDENRAVETRPRPALKPPPTERPPAPDKAPEQTSPRAVAPDTAHARSSAGAAPDHVRPRGNGRAGAEVAVSALTERIFGVASNTPPPLEVENFAGGEAFLPESLKRKLDDLVKLLKLAPERRVLVGGYADDFKDSVKNMRLSDARARAVDTYLVEHGVDPRRVWATGLGKPKSQEAGESKITRGVRIALR